MSIAVVGGGLAGIAAALRLADQGQDVTLLESRARLGGLTHSFRRGDLWIDNGQHVFMRCCTEYLALLDRLGVGEHTLLQDRLDLPVRSEHDPRQIRLRRTGLPAPFHLATALLRYRCLPWRERMRIAPVALAMRALDVRDPTVDAQNFGAWLRARGCSDRSIEVFWELIGKATLNADADNSSLALAATVFQLGILQDSAAADLGWATLPLQQLHGDAATCALAGAGATVSLRTKVTAVRPATCGWLVETAEHTMPFDQVVVAVPPSALGAITDLESLGLPLDLAERLGTSPIVNLHLILDRPVLTSPFVAAIDGPLQWIFDRTASSGLSEGQYLAISLSAADGLIGMTVAQLREWAMPHLRALLPGTGEAIVRDFFVTREPEATFAPAPGTAAARPSSPTPAAGLVLAGAWTDTGWPATMEGAVRSGHTAAALLRPAAHGDHLKETAA